MFEAQCRGRSLRLARGLAGLFAGTWLASGATAQTYTYDSLGRVTSKTTAASTANYGYDAAGNRTSYNSTSTNHAPVANADSCAVTVSTLKNCVVLANDTDADGDALTVSYVTSPAHGSATTNGTTVSYTPTTGYTGSDSLTYTVIDSHGASASAVLTLTIASANRNPVAVSDSISATAGTAKTFDPRANDTDADGDTLTVSAVGSASHGTTSKTTSSITYTPTAGYSGSDSFTYTISDGHGGAATGTVTAAVTVANRAPVATSDSITATAGTAKVFDPRTNDTDADGDTLTITAVSAASHGTTSKTTTSITYTPTSGYAGSDSFTYTISDGHGGTATGTVTATVGLANRAPVAKADSIAATAGTAKVFDPRTNDTDADGDALTVTTVGAAGHGTTSFTSTSVTYTPTSGYGGSDSFTYTISDGRGGTSSATVTASVTISNRPPVANNDSISASAGTPTSFDPRGNDSDPDGNAISVTLVGGAAHGSTSTNGASITYTPTAGYGGSDSFSYTISDGQGGTASATVFATVTVPNSPPYANNDGCSTAYNTAVTCSVLSNDGDPDGNPLSIVSVSGAANGSVSNNGSSITYTPNSGFSGSDSFSYTISDGYGGTASASVSISVAPRPNQAPTANQDTAEVTSGDPVSINVIANDTDPDGDTLQVTDLYGGNGSAYIVNSTTIGYNPSPNPPLKPSYDTYTYTISDGHGGTASGTVRFHLNSY